VRGKTTMVTQQYRQGDVLLKRIGSLPAGAERQGADGGRIVLAYGEVTGHAHAIDAAAATMYRSGNKDILETRKGAVLRHEEHTALPLEPGYYEVIRQREYEHQGWRQVAD